MISKIPGPHIPKEIPEVDVEFFEQATLISPPPLTEVEQLKRDNENLWRVNHMLSEEIQKLHKQRAWWRKAWEFLSLVFIHLYIMIVGPYLEWRHRKKMRKSLDK